MATEHQDLPKSCRKSRDVQAQRDPDQAPDLAGLIFALQRTKNSASSRPRERHPQSPPSSSKTPVAIDQTQVNGTRRTSAPRVVVSKPDADAEDFSRRLKISPSPRTHQASTSKSPKLAHANKLYNPETDPIPMRHTAEPDSTTDSDSFVPRGGNPSRQLYNHRKDDPVRFSVLATGRPMPSPQSSGDYVSASSTSSYTPSTHSSNFSLSSTTDGSSASSALFEKKELGNDVFAGQLKRIYRTITALEGKIANEDAAEEAREEAVRITLKGKGKEKSDEDAEQQRWLKVIANHKALAETIHNFLEISLNPALPASLRNIPTKYNIIIRLWTRGFHKLLESLRRASFTSPLALELLVEFIYYAYTFYTGIFEEPTLKTFRSAWLEALGDLARYRMAVAAMVNGTNAGGEALTVAALSSFPRSPSPSSSNQKTRTNSTPSARLDGSPSPSVGIAAAKLLDVEPEKERWRIIARDWYGIGLADTPGNGKLHHHLGLLSRDVGSEEMRGVYHFVKSMTTLHAFATSRESILPIWSAKAQSRRAQPDAKVSDLFVLLHGMLFTNIQLDDFHPTLARFMERLSIEGAEEREWIMMGIINVCAVLEYGKTGAIIRRAGGLGGKDAAPALRVMAKRVDDGVKMDVDDVRTEEDVVKSSIVNGIPQSPAMSAVSSTPSGPEDYPASFSLALQLTFTMLSHVLQFPKYKASPFAKSTVNPYLTITLTFLATICEQEKVLRALERNIPWEDLATFLARVPRHVMLDQGLNVTGARSGVKAGGEGEPWTKLASGCIPPLDEDWCMRGMEWSGRRVYERGYWKPGEDRTAEIEVLNRSEPTDATDGIIESEDDEETKGSGGKHQPAALLRWVRIVRCSVRIADLVDGFRWVEGSRAWVVEGTLADKVKKWREEERAEREEEERRRTRSVRWDDEDSMDVDDEMTEEYESGGSDDELASEEVKALKARRRYYRSLLQGGNQVSWPSTPPAHRPRSHRPRKEASAPPSLNIVPGYTVLVVDTNILLSSLQNIISLVESFRWTVLVPLPVIMELDGLSTNASKLGEAASAATAYITSNVRTHSRSLKVQTSKGNYLTTLNVRSEQVDFSGGDTDWERNMDDLILKAAIWQDDHWVDRSALLKGSETSDVPNPVKVVLLTLDRNLRLKARSRQLPAASEKDIASILTSGS